MRFALHVLNIVAIDIWMNREQLQKANIDIYCMRPIDKRKLEECEMILKKNMTMENKYKKCTARRTKRTGNMYILFTKLSFIVNCDNLLCLLPIFNKLHSIRISMLIKYDEHGSIGSMCVYNL